jgi:hypothetical protein
MVRIEEKIMNSLLAELSFYISRKESILKTYEIIFRKLEVRFEEKFI